MKLPILSTGIEEDLKGLKNLFPSRLVLPIIES